MQIEIAEPPSGSDGRVESTHIGREQLRLALCNVRPNSWLMPVFAAIMCVMFSRWIPPRTLALWWMAMVLGGLPLGYVCARVLNPPEGERSQRDWTVPAVAAFGVAALSWSSLGFFLWVPGDAVNHMFVLIIIAASLAANAALIGASRPMTIMGLAIYGFTLIATPLQQGGSLYAGLSILAFFYLGYLAHLSNTFYLTARDMLLLRDDKNELIAALAKSKAESDEARWRAEAASRTKSEFLANMSHELRTPLNAIIGFSEMINSGAFEKKNIEYSQLINDSGHHLLALINDILDLAKIEAGRLTLQETDVDLHLMIADCAALMAGKALTAGLTLSQQIQSGLPALYADDRALRQVIINLLSNAVKFTPSGGCVTVDARLQDDGWIAIEVSDNGTGIAEEDLQRVFESFGQGRHDVVSSDRGTGLGLPIVKGLIAAHGGSIALRSQVGSGTSVTICFPVARVRSQPPLKAVS